MKEVQLSTEEMENLTKQINADVIEVLSKFSSPSGISKDLSDIGNEIGFAVGKHVSYKNYFGFHKDDFIAGFRHGISLTDGTH